MGMHRRLGDYVLKISKGLLHLNKEHMEEIERIVREPRAFAKLSRWNNANESWDQQYTETLTNDDAVRIAEVQSMKKPIEGFMKWEIYNADGLKIAELYNIKASINQLLQ